MYGVPACTLPKKGIVYPQRILLTWGANMNPYWLLLSSVFWLLELANRNSFFLDRKLTDLREVMRLDRKKYIYRYISKCLSEWDLLCIVNRWINFLTYCVPLYAQQDIPFCSNGFQP
jgi:hypothetical protein